MRLFIPKLGEKLTLADDWTFALHWEYRNTDFIERVDGRAQAYKQEHDAYWESGRNPLLEPKRPHPSKVFPQPFTLPRGTVVTIDRIYIRKNADDYNSVTFRVKKGDCPDATIYGRFWVKLDDANKMEI
jgi:hypothetical protein